MSPHGSKQNWDSYEFEGNIRRLTPTECERLQGFPDGWTEFGQATQWKCPVCEWDCTELGECAGRECIVDQDEDIAEIKISDTQRYKTLGNAVTVNVIKDICEKLNKNPSLK